MGSWRILKNLKMSITKFCILSMIIVWDFNNQSSFTHALNVESQTTWIWQATTNNSSFSPIGIGNNITITSNSIRNDHEITFPTQLQPITPNDSKPLENPSVKLNLLRQEQRSNLQRLSEYISFSRKSNRSSGSEFEDEKDSPRPKRKTNASKRKQRNVRIRETATSSRISEGMHERSDIAGLNNRRKWSDLKEKDLSNSQILSFHQKDNANNSTSTYGATDFLLPPYVDSLKDGSSSGNAKTTTSPILSSTSSTLDTGQIQIENNPHKHYNYTSLLKSTKVNNHNPCYRHGRHFHNNLNCILTTTTVYPTSTTVYPIKSQVTMRLLKSRKISTKILHPFFTSVPPTPSPYDSKTTITTSSSHASLVRPPQSSRLMNFYEVLPTSPEPMSASFLPIISSSSSSSLLLPSSSSLSENSTSQESYEHERLSSLQLIPLSSPISPYFNRSVITTISLPSTSRPNIMNSFLARPTKAQAMHLIQIPIQELSPPKGIVKESDSDSILLPQRLDKNILKMDILMNYSIGDLNDNVDSNLVMELETGNDTWNLFSTISSHFISKRSTFYPTQSSGSATPLAEIKREGEKEASYFSQDLIKTTIEPTKFVIPNEDERDELVRRFKLSHQVKLWSLVGFYDDDYLQQVNSHWLQFDPANPMIHKILGILYGVIMVVGCGGNLLVIVMFFRCRSLRTPPNYLIVNLAVSDFLMMIKMPVFIFNSLYGGPALGSIGCKIYGFVGGLSGTASIMTLSAIALDRYCVISYPLILKRTTSTKAIIMICGVWVYSGIFSSIPLLGVNGYVSEGYLTSCSFDYLSDSVSDRVFVFIFFIAAFVLPLAIIVFSYNKIFRTVRSAERQEIFNPLSPTNLTRESFKCKHEKKKQKTEVKIAVLSSTIILVWLLAWTPYAIVALLGIFGYKNLITPLVSAIPALFCKTASCIDPFMYAINHPRFQRELKNKFQKCYPLAKAPKRRSSNEVSYYSNPSITFKDDIANSGSVARKEINRSTTSGGSSSSPESSVGGKSRFNLGKTHHGSPNGGTSGSSNTNSPASITFNLKEMDAGGTTVRFSKTLKKSNISFALSPSPLAKHRVNTSSLKNRTIYNNNGTGGKQKTENLNHVMPQKELQSTSKFLELESSGKQTVQEQTRKKTETEIFGEIMSSSIKKNHIEKISLGNSKLVHAKSSSAIVEPPNSQNKFKKDCPNVNGILSVNDDEKNNMINSCNGKSKSLDKNSNSSAGGESICDLFGGDESSREREQQILKREIRVLEAKVVYAKTAMCLYGESNKEIILDTKCENKAALKMNTLGHTPLETTIM